VYKLSGQFPKSEIYGLTSQLRRSSVSIAANIAEGFKKNGIADKLRYFNIAQGSLAETRYYLILSQDLGYCDSTLLCEQLEEVSKILDSYISTIHKTAH
jgi:four helix bundle protein